MTPEKARESVENIRRIAHDDERAHVEEDRLREAFIHAVADGGYDTIEEAAKAAREVLQTDKIDFCRWCA